MARIDPRGSAGPLWPLPGPCGGCRCCSDQLHFVAVRYVIDPRPQASNPVSRFVCPSAVAGWRNHFLQPTWRQQGGKVVSGPAGASETGLEGANAILEPWTPATWTLRGFAVFASVLMVLVAFSQTVGPAASTSTGAEDVFEEQSRRLTVADGLSRLPKGALGARGSMQI